MRDAGVDLHFTAIAKIENADAATPRQIRLNEAAALATAFDTTLASMLDQQPSNLPAARSAAKAAGRQIAQAAQALEDARGLIETVLDAAATDGAADRGSLWINSLRSCLETGGSPTATTTTTEHIERLRDVWDCLSERLEDAHRQERAARAQAPE